MQARCYDAPDRVSSLNELLEVNAETYVKIGEVFNKIDSLFDGGMLAGLLTVPPDKILWLRANLPTLARHCEVLELPVTHGIIMQFYDDYHDVNPTWADALMRLNWIKGTFKQELRARLFMHVYQERTPYYSNLFVQGGRVGYKIAEFLPIFDAYPSTRYDIMQAGNAYSYELFTAAVYHLMRVAEYGLVSVVLSLGDAAKNPSWDGMISTIHGRINRMASEKIKPDGWKADEQFYGETVGYFQDIKIAWRNPVSHVPRTYQPEQAEGVFTVTRNVMTLLATRLREPDIMPATIILPEEDQPKATAVMA